VQHFCKDVKTFYFLCRLFGLRQPFPTGHLASQYPTARTQTAEIHIIVMQGADPGWAIGTIVPFKSTQVALLTMIFCNSENSIRDTRPLWSSIVLSQQCCEIYFIPCSRKPLGQRLDYPVVLKSPPPLTLHAGSGAVLTPRTADIQQNK